jgi:hypothetical protein
VKSRRRTQGEDDDEPEKEKAPRVMLYGEDVEVVESEGAAAELSKNKK